MLGFKKKGRRTGQMTSPKRDLETIFDRRAVWMSTAGVLAMGAIGARLTQLQATDFFSGQYTHAADDNRFDQRLIAPPRGVVYDRFGVPLAVTSKDYRVSIIPERADNLEGAIRSVALILHLDEAWVRRRVRDARADHPYAKVPLRQGLTWEEFAAINVRLPELRGVTAESTSMRSYPYDIVFAHPIGYVQKPSQRDIERAQAEGAAGESRAIYYRNPDVRVGKAGVEASLERTLRGEAGWSKIIVNAFGREMGEDVDAREEAVPGSGVVLTIDAELQRRAMELFGEQSGAAMVMDVVTGDLLVMASAPGFDPNQFVNGIAFDDFRALNENERKPLFHKSVAGTYSPGSTFKMMVGIAAKQAGVEDDWHVNCPGYFPFGGRNFHCWKHSGHGNVNLHLGLKYSCDVYFYQAALRAGPERIANVAREFGFGTIFDVNVPQVAQGIVPDPDWWRRIGRGQWTPGLTVNFGIGQGDLQVTPLQLVTMASRIANNGRAVTPRLVREAPGVSDPPAPPQIAGINPDHLARVRDGMFAVCNEPGGTATRAGDVQLVRRPEDRRIIEAGPGTAGFQRVQIAGKTGTAQVRVITAAERARGTRSNESLDWRLRDNALFTCFGPWDEPRYACAVVVEHGGGGSAVAGPIGRELMRATMLRDPSRRAAARLAALDARAERPA